ncbi:hypothetical protein J6590_104627 [Homalodisca vitripennis]|nr:hypothetical protein J6590_104627 [Homalodisca vitripennis]
MFLSNADHYVQEVFIKETTTTTSQRPTASSATKELDDLMASLSDFKVQLEGMNQPEVNSPESLGLRLLVNRLRAMVVMPTNMKFAFTPVAEQQNCVLKPGAAVLLSQSSIVTDCPTQLSTAHNSRFLLVGSLTAKSKVTLTDGRTNCQDAISVFWHLCLVNTL